MNLKGFEAVFTQFRDPDGAYALLKGDRQGGVLAGTVITILLIGCIPFLLQGFSHVQMEIPLWIAAERLLISLAGGIAVYTLSFAGGGKKPLWPAVSSCFMSMGAFMILLVLLSGLSYLLSLPLGFSWSFAELFNGLPVSRLSVFGFVFFSRLGVASLVTVYLWGRGLSAVWDLERAAGQRMVWAVYLFGILLLALPVFFAPPAAEGAI